MKFTIEAFQSIEQSTAIELQGLTVITGESNAGKSAIIRAIRAFRENYTGDWFITDGKEATHVFQEWNGHSIHWHKSRKTTEYRIDGKEFKKAGKGEAPSEIKMSGLLPVEAQGRQYWPQIRSQHDPLFILQERSPTVAAELLSASKHSVRLSRALKIGKSQQTKETAEISVREENYKKTAGRLALAEESEKVLDPLEVLLDQAKETVDKQRAELEKFRSLQQRWRLECGRLDAVAQRPLDSIKDFPKLPDLPRLQRVKHQYSRAKEQELGTRDIQDFRFEEISDKLWSRLKSVRIWAAEVRGILQYPVPEISSCTITTETWLQLRKFRQEYTKRENLIELKVPAPREITGLVEQRGIWKQLKNWCDERRRRLKVEHESLGAEGRASEELVQVEKEKGQILKQLGYCPVCGAQK